MKQMFTKHLLIQRYLAAQERGFHFDVCNHYPDGQQHLHGEWYRTDGKWLKNISVSL